MGLTAIKTKGLMKWPAFPFQNCVHLASILGRFVNDHPNGATHDRRNGAIK